MIRIPNPLIYLALCIATLAICSYAQASDDTDYVQIAKLRLAELDEIDMRETWFYTITTHTEAEVLVARNDPGKEEGKRRVLISVNGEPPSQERLEKFEKQQAEREKDSDDEDKLSDMVDYSTLAFEEVVNGQVILSYNPDLDGLEKEADKLNGTLKLNADTHLVEELGINNTEKISPAFSVSLTTFKMRFLFLAVDGEMLMSGMKTSIEGKAGFLKKFKENTEIVFSDYQRKL